MASITLKLSTLVIRTLAKPFANKIKSQAREHESFRRVCITFAQWLHRTDMRLRLGLLQNPDAIDRQSAKEATKEAVEAKIKKQKIEIPTVKTEAQMKADEATAMKENEKGGEKSKASSTPKVRIRPLSEAKAIDTGANFLSETVLFLVAGGLIVFESWRSRRKESSRRVDVAERMAELEENERIARKALVDLEKEILRLRAKDGTSAQTPKHILPKEILQAEGQDEQEDERIQGGWWSWAKRVMRSDLPSPEPTQNAAVSSPPDHPRKDSVQSPQVNRLERLKPASGDDNHRRSVTEPESKKNTTA